MRNGRRKRRAVEVTVMEPYRRVLERVGEYDFLCWVGFLEDIGDVCLRLGGGDE